MIPVSSQPGRESRTAIARPAATAMTPSADFAAREQHQPACPIATAGGDEVRQEAGPAGAVGIASRRAERPELVPAAMLDLDHDRPLGSASDAGWSGWRTRGRLAAVASAISRTDR